MYLSRRPGRIKDCLAERIAGMIRRMKKPGYDTGRTVHKGEREDVARSFYFPFKQG